MSAYATLNRYNPPTQVPVVSAVKPGFQVTPSFDGVSYTVPNYDSLTGPVAGAVPHPRFKSIYSAKGDQVSYEVTQPLKAGLAAGGSPQAGGSLQAGGEPYGVSLDEIGPLARESYRESFDNRFNKKIDYKPTILGKRDHK